MMLRIFFWIAAMMLTAVAAPAYASITDEVISCADTELPESVKSQLAKFGNGTETGITPETAQAIANATNRCAQRYPLTQEEEKTVRSYVTASRIADSAGAYLAGVGMPLAVLHKTFDFGPGYRNVKITQMTPEMIDGLLKAFAEAGVDASIFTTREWNVMGVYVGSETDRQTLLVPFQQ